ncbi:hypothetical protein KCU65_g9871, partial [Aureobasidium melanogenum]
MVPWKIVYSAESLLNFMIGLAVFLCPIASIMATDYWLVKKRHINVPGLYRRHGQYRYTHDINWRAVVALLSSLVPNIPGLASSVNKSLSIPSGFAHIYDMNYLYGFVSASFVYWSLSYFSPAKSTLLEASVYDDDPAVIVGMQLAESYAQRTTNIVQDGSKSQFAVYYADSRARGGSNETSFEQ